MTEQRTISQPPKGNFLKAVSAIVWKDLQAEFRSRELFSAMLVLSLLIIMIFNFALELDIKTRQSVTSGVLWATFAFAGTLGLNRSMAIEKDRTRLVAERPVKDGFDGLRKVGRVGSTGDKRRVDL